MASGMAVVSHGELRAAIGQIRHADFFGGFMNDVVEAAPGNLREIFAIRIAGTILNGAGHAHVFFGFGKPRSDFRVVDGPIFAEAIAAGGFEVDVTVARGGAAPEIGFAAGAFAALPIPIGAGRVGIGDVMFEKFWAFSVFAFFDGIVFLMGASREAQWIAEASVFKIEGLAMHAVVLGRIGARTGVERENAEAGFAEKLHGHAAASAGANYDRVENFCGHGSVSSNLQFSALRFLFRSESEGACVQDRRDARSRASWARRCAGRDSRDFPGQFWWCRNRRRCNRGAFEKNRDRIRWWA